MTAALTACHECDLLQREIAMHVRGIVRCARCEAPLYRSDPAGLQRALAYTVGAAVLFVMANTFPLVGLRVKGELIETTLFGAAQVLYADGMRTLGAVVFVTTVVAPLIELIATAVLLVTLGSGRQPAGGAVYRILRGVLPWGMVEVMMLGVLVALVKLAHLAGLVPGIGMWSFFALMMLLAATAASFDPRALWARLERGP
jgi:paraquat-inducible protein A